MSGRRALPELTPDQSRKAHARVLKRIEYALDRVHVARQGSARVASVHQTTHAIDQAMRGTGLLSPEGRPSLLIRYETARDLVRILADMLLQAEDAEREGDAT